MLCEVKFEPKSCPVPCTNEATISMTIGGFWKMAICEDCRLKHRVLRGQVEFEPLNPATHVSGQITPSQEKP